jgi:hypothetical protein
VRLGASVRSDEGRDLAEGANLAQTSRNALIVGRNYRPEVSYLDRGSGGKKRRTALRERNYQTRQSRQAMPVPRLRCDEKSTSMSGILCSDERARMHDKPPGQQQRDWS